MKKITFFIIMVTLLVSCRSTSLLKINTPQQLVANNLKQLKASKEIVFKSVMSCLMSDGFFIENADISTGLVTAYKKTSNKRNTKKLIHGYIQYEYTSKISLYIETLNSNLTELSMVLYMSTATFNTDEHKIETEQLIEEQAVYNVLFERIEQELDRRCRL